MAIAESQGEMFMVRFQFRIGKAFLDYPAHPITIPKRQYEALEQEKLTEHPLTVESPFGSMQGVIYYGRQDGASTTRSGWMENPRVTV